ncbi:hypothetical protein DFH11DRAFT_728392 [Phellopilus nigrolimitatus]|nr:hypothetical protein DFH11DRAFT_728392 [Phellopilus nigrolimitatus]
MGLFLLNGYLSLVRFVGSPVALMNTVRRLLSARSGKAGRADPDSTEGYLGMHDCALLSQSTIVLKAHSANSRRHKSSLTICSVDPPVDGTRALRGKAPQRRFAQKAREVPRICSFFVSATCRSLLGFPPIETDPVILHLHTGNRTNFLSPSLGINRDTLVAGWVRGCARSTSVFYSRVESWATIFGPISVFVLYILTPSLV